MSDVYAEAGLGVDVQGEDAVQRLAEALNALQESGARVQSVVTATSGQAATRLAQEQIKAGIKSAGTRAQQESGSLGARMARGFGAAVERTIKDPFLALAASGKMVGNAALSMGGSLGRVSQQLGPTTTAVAGLGLAVTGLAVPLLNLVLGFKMLKTSFGWAQEGAEEQIRVAGRARRFYPAAMGEAMSAAEDQVRVSMATAGALFGAAADSMQESITRRLTPARLAKGWRGDKDLFARWGITPENMRRYEAEVGRMDLTDWLRGFVFKREQLEAQLQAPGTSPGERANITRALGRLSDDVVRVFGQRFADTMAAMGTRDIAKLQVAMKAAIPLGHVENATKRAVAFEIAWNSVKNTFSQIGTGIGRDVQPAVTSFLDALNTKLLPVEQGGQGLGTMFRELAAAMSNKAWQVLKEVMERIKPETVTGWIKEVQRWDPSSTADSIGRFFGAVADFGAGLAQLHASIYDVIDALPASWLAQREAVQVPGGGKTLVPGFGEVKAGEIERIEAQRRLRQLQKRERELRRREEAGETIRPEERISPEEMAAARKAAGRWFGTTPATAATGLPPLSGAGAAAAAAAEQGRVTVAANQAQLEQSREVARLVREQGLTAAQALEQVQKAAAVTAEAPRPPTAINAAKVEVKAAAANLEARQPLGTVPADKASEAANAAIVASNTAADAARVAVEAQASASAEKQYVFNSPTARALRGFARGATAVGRGAGQWLKWGPWSGARRLAAGAVRAGEWGLGQAGISQAAAAELPSVSGPVSTTGFAGGAVRAPGGITLAGAPEVPTAVEAPPPTRPGWVRRTLGGFGRLFRRAAPEEVKPEPEALAAVTAEEMPELQAIDVESVSITTPATEIEARQPLGTRLVERATEAANTAIEAAKVAARAAAVAITAPPPPTAYGAQLGPVSTQGFAPPGGIQLAKPEAVEAPTRAGWFRRALGAIGGAVPPLTPGMARRRLARQAGITAPELPALSVISRAGAAELPAVVRTTEEAPAAAAAIEPERLVAPADAVVSAAQLPEATPVVPMQALTGGVPAAVSVAQQPQAMVVPVETVAPASAFQPEERVVAVGPSSTRGFAGGAVRAPGGGIALAGAPAAPAAVAAPEAARPGWLRRTLGAVGGAARGLFRGGLGAVGRGGAEPPVGAGPPVVPVQPEVAAGEIAPETLVVPSTAVWPASNFPPQTPVVPPDSVVPPQVPARPEAIQQAIDVPRTNVAPVNIVAPASAFKPETRVSPLLPAPRAEGGAEAPPTGAPPAAGPSPGPAGTVPAGAGPPGGGAAAMPAEAPEMATPPGGAAAPGPPQTPALTQEPTAAPTPTGGPAVPAAITAAAPTPSPAITGAPTGAASGPPPPPQRPTARRVTAGAREGFVPPPQPPSVVPAAVAEEPAMPTGEAAAAAPAAPPMPAITATTAPATGAPTAPSGVEAPAAEPLPEAAPAMPTPAAVPPTRGRLAPALREALPTPPPPTLAMPMPTPQPAAPPPAAPPAPPAEAPADKGWRGWLGGLFGGKPPGRSATAAGPRFGSERGIDEAAAGPLDQLKQSFDATTSQMTMATTPSGAATMMITAPGGQGIVATQDTQGNTVVTPTTSTGPAPAPPAAEEGIRVRPEQVLGKIGRAAMGARIAADLLGGGKASTALQVIQGAAEGAEYGAGGYSQAWAGLAGVIPGSGVLEFMHRDAQQGHPWRTQFRSWLGLEDPGEPAPWQPGGQFHPQAPSDETPLLGSSNILLSQYQGPGGLTASDGEQFGAAAAEQFRAGLQGYQLPAGLSMTSWGVTPRGAPPPTGGDTASEA